MSPKVSSGIEVGPTACTFDYDARHPHPRAFCPVCGAAKLVYRETCSDFCGEMLWLTRKYSGGEVHPESH